MLRTEFFLVVVKKEDIESIMSKSYYKYTTIKEIIIPKEGNEEHYSAIYSNFSNPLVDLKDKSLFSMSMNLNYDSGVENTFKVNFEFEKLISDGITSGIGHFYILDEDEKVLVDISNYSGNAKIEGFVTMLNKHTCKESIYKANRVITNIINGVDNSLMNPKETIVE